MGATSLEIEEARRWIEGLPPARQPKLLAFIDGVGFRSNSSGLNGVLEKSDEFFQFRTMWKALVVIAAQTGERRQVYLPEDDIDRFSSFIDRYDARDIVQPREGLRDTVGLIEAGEALVRG